MLTCDRCGGYLFDSATVLLLDEHPPRLACKRVACVGSPFNGRGMVDAGIGPRTLERLLDLLVARPDEAAEIAEMIKAAFTSPDAPGVVKRRKAGRMAPSRRKRLLAELAARCRRDRRPVTAEDVADVLGITTESARRYVADLSHGVRP